MALRAHTAVSVRAPPASGTPILSFNARLLPASALVSGRFRDRFGGHSAPFVGTGSGYSSPAPADFGYGHSWVSQPSPHGRSVPIIRLSEVCECRSE
jgi:hypothetical protein